jgi:hypothetical protein
MPAILKAIQLLHKFQCVNSRGRGEARGGGSPRVLYPLLERFANAVQLRLGMTLSLPCCLPTSLVVRPLLALGFVFVFLFRFVGLLLV